MADRTDRIQFLDLMRGFAVVVMVIGHSVDSVLSLDARTTDAFRLYDAVRGFTAPIFLFVSGLAFTVATEKRWLDYRTLGRPVWKRLGKLTLLFALGYLLHIPFLSLSKLISSTSPQEYAQMWQVDVLHCVAASLLILQVLVFLCATPRSFAFATAAVAGALVLGAPLIWSVNFASIVSPVVSPYLNQQQVSIFPLFPFAAFLLVGAVVGHFLLEAKRQHKGRLFLRTLLLASGAMAVFGVVFDLLPITVLPAHDYWKASPNFFLLRLAVVFLVTVGFCSLRKIPAWTTRNVIILGQASLLVYAAHLLVVYGSVANNGLTQVIGRTLPSYQALGVGILVLLGMLGLVYLWNYAQREHVWTTRFAQAAAVSILLFNFITKPF